MARNPPKRFAWPVSRPFGRLVRRLPAVSPSRRPCSASARLTTATQSTRNQSCPVCLTRRRPRKNSENGNSQFFTSTSNGQSGG